MIRSSDGRITAIDGREMAPAAATKDMFVRDGEAIPGASQTGPLASGCAGALAAYQLAIERCGTMKLARLLEPGIEKAANGFPIRRGLAAAIAGTREQFAKIPGLGGDLSACRWHAARSKANGWCRPIWRTRIGNCRARDRIGSTAGRLPKMVGEWMAANGGIITAADFAAYEAKLREPLETTYRGYTIIGFPPPSSGGVHVAQVLNMLEPFDMRAIEKRDPRRGGSHHRRGVQAGVCRSGVLAGRFGFRRVCRAG